MKPDRSDAGEPKKHLSLKQIANNMIWLREYDAFCRAYGLVETERLMKTNKHSKELIQEMLKQLKEIK